MEDPRHLIEVVRTKVVDWIYHVVGLLPNMVSAVLVVLLAWLVGRMLLRAIAPLTARVVPSPTIRKLLHIVLYLIVLVIGTFAALSILHLDKTVTSLLAGAGILGLAFSLAFQDLASNFIAGVVMAMQNPVRIGDLVETAGQYGVVEHIGLRTTGIRNLQGVRVILPNKEVFQNVLINYTYNGVRRVDLVTRVRLDADLERTQRVLSTAVEAVPDVLPEHPVDVFYQEFAESGIVFEVRFWITSDSNRHFHTVRSNAIMAIRKALDAEGIVVPAPVRTVEVRPTQPGS